MEKKMKDLFKSKRKTPLELVRHINELILFLDRNPDIRQTKQNEKMSDLSKSILELRSVLYGVEGAEPSPDACAQVTQEFFREDTFRILIKFFPRMEVGARQDATHVLANLQRQRVNSQLPASEYLEKNLDLVDILATCYEDEEIALTYGAVLKGCIRHQVVARYILESKHMKNFFNYIQCPNFEIASDAATTFRELLTRHKSTVGAFLSNNYLWFFQEYNSQLLQSSNYITRRHAIRLLGELLLDRSNTAVMLRYVSSLDNLRILMNLLRESNKTIQIDAFHVFKLFVANEKKPPEIVAVLVGNRSKLLRFFGDFGTDREDEQFEADKSQIVKEIATLEPPHNSGPTLGKCESFHLG